MKIKVAGYNIDADLLERFRSMLRYFADYYEGEDIDPAGGVRSFLAMDNLTPETISAAYARISRDPAQIGVLRSQACYGVARARRSNSKIIFDMGHASVAEHAVFNIDVTGVSRLATEEIEARRLMSFTEKSQRYIALQREFVVPSEIRSTPLEGDFSALCRDLFDAYSEFLPPLEKHFASMGVERSDLSAREDARYLLPLATGAQFGMTANARSIEHLLRRTINHPLVELRDFARQLRAEVEKTTPSLIRHLDNQPEPVEQITLSGKVEDVSEDVILFHFTPEGDTATIAALLFGGESASWAEAWDRASAMNQSARKSYLRDKLSGLKAFDSLPREYELAHFRYQLRISASAYAQLKRHRITTQLVKPYNPALGITIPRSIVEAGLEGEFSALMRRVEDLYYRMVEENPAFAQYILTNAHRRLVIFQANAREMHHLARLRMDNTAQWDIRRLAMRMVELAREKAPLTMELACGKDEFDRASRDFFGE